MGYQGWQIDHRGAARQLSTGKVSWGVFLARLYSKKSLQEYFQRDNYLLKRSGFISPNKPHRSRIISRIIGNIGQSSGLDIQFKNVQFTADILIKEDEFRIW